MKSQLHSDGLPYRLLDVIRQYPGLTPAGYATLTDEDPRHTQHALRRLYLAKRVTRETAIENGRRSHTYYLRSRKPKAQPAAEAPAPVATPAASEPAEFDIDSMTLADARALYDQLRNIFEVRA